MTVFKRIVAEEHYKKKELVIACLCIVLLAGSWFVMDQRSEIRSQKLEVGSQKSEVGSQKPEVGSQKSEVRDQGFCKEGFECFNDFIVYLKDDRGKDRVLICDVVVELNQKMELSQKKIELRKNIYNTLKKLSGFSEIKRELKEEIKSSLNKFMDDEIIKDVYFTKFVLL
ncbi:MAG: flagellar basal body-associated FliL family protein [Deltaproteobacteria bacterium]|nr:flagellar basal body-associated FliL family protein [Deltaproteobacteria bacterium]